MVTAEEIRELVNKQWADRRSSIDEIMSMVAVTQLETNEKVNILIDTLSRGLDVDPTINPTIDYTTSLKGLEGYALTDANKDGLIAIIVGNRAITGVAKNDIVQYEKVIITGGDDAQPDIVAIPLIMKTIINNEIEQSNILLNKDALNINAGSNIAADGSYKQFDITDFANNAKILQVVITQLTSGAANYTFEIWEKDSSSYSVTDRGHLYLRTYSRDFTVSEDSDIIEPSLLYVDRDSTKELHCRLVNNAGGTASDFSVNIKAEGNPF